MITIIGGLELKTPPWANEMHEHPYRLARLAQSQGGPLTEGGDSNPNLITFQRTWVRPWAFFALDDKSLRDKRQATAQQSVVGASISEGSSCSHHR